VWTRLLPEPGNKKGTKKTGGKRGGIVSLKRDCLAKMGTFAHLRGGEVPRMGFKTSCFYMGGDLVWPRVTL